MQTSAPARKMAEIYLLASSLLRSKRECVRFGNAKPLSSCVLRMLIAAASTNPKQCKTFYQGISRQIGLSARGLCCYCAISKKFARIRPLADALKTIIAISAIYLSFAVLSNPCRRSALSGPLLIYLILEPFGIKNHSQSVIGRLFRCLLFDWAD